MSEQPVAVCPACELAKHAGNCNICGRVFYSVDRVHVNNGTTAHTECFHSSTEQGSQPECTNTCHPRDGHKADHPNCFPKPEPTAQTVAGEPKRCKTCACKLCEDCENDEQCCGCEDMKVIADLRRQLADSEKIRRAEKEILIKEIEEHTKTRAQLANLESQRKSYAVIKETLESQLAERDAVIEKVRKNLAGVDKIKIEQLVARVGKLLAIVSASPSTILESSGEPDYRKRGWDDIDQLFQLLSVPTNEVYRQRALAWLESVRQEERERCAKALCYFCRTNPGSIERRRGGGPGYFHYYPDTPLGTVCSAAAIRQNPEAEKEKKA